MVPFLDASTECEAWLRREMAEFCGATGACVFGSALSVKSPRDVDLCIVTDARIGSGDWHQIRTQRDSLAMRFQAAFALPLSAMLVTVGEWDEIDGVIVRERRVLLP